MPAMPTLEHLAAAPKANIVGRHAINSPRLLSIESAATELCWLSLVPVACTMHPSHKICPGLALSPALAKTHHCSEACLPTCSNQNASGLTSSLAGASRNLLGFPRRFVERPTSARCEARAAREAQMARAPAMRGGARNARGAPRGANRGTPSELHGLHGLQLHAPCGRSTKPSKCKPRVSGHFK